MIKRKSLKSEYLLDFSKDLVCLPQKQRQIFQVSILALSQVMNVVCLSTFLIFYNTWLNHFSSKSIIAFDLSIKLLKNKNLSKTRLRFT